MHNSTQKYLIYKRTSSPFWSIEVILTHPVAGYAEGRVLDGLKFLNKGWWDIGEPNGSCIHEKIPDKGHIGDKYGYLLLTPVGARKGLEDVDTG